PIGMGKQDLYFGKPMPPEELSALPYKERKERVIAAINALGPANAVEEPLPGDPAFAALVDERVGRTGASHEHATLLEVLRELGDPHPEIRELIEAEDEGLLTLSGDGKGRWLAELARRLYGERGAKVIVGGR
ncbi:MAG TPA: hypothetical protein DFS52_05500, partial [Myxococcales bacterium]|nr:hypothetical protein [Myxococcales bacterium]